MSAFLFESYFSKGKDFNQSPFLKPDAKHWGEDLPIKVSILSLILLIIAFVVSFYSLNFSYFILTFVYFFSGVPSLIDSIEDLCDLNINIDILMTFAAFSSVLLGSPLEGALLLVLFEISGSLEEFVSHKAKGAIHNLHSLAPTSAYVVQEDGSLILRSIKEISVGEKIFIKAGEVVPLDSLVIEGRSSVNLVHLTGESLPVTKVEKDIVPAGAHNMEGTLTLEVTHTNSDSTLARIIQLITEAQEARPKLQRWFDRFSQRYATSIISTAFLLALFMPYFLSIPFLGPTGSVYRALTFLIAASPCALIIAVPIAYLSAVSSCARMGILLKGGITLDAIASTSVIAFDKTGTLTTGQLKCKGLEPLDTSDSQLLLEAIALSKALEKGAVHPIARAVESFDTKETLPSIKIEQFEQIPGFGLQAIFNQQIVKIGSIPFIEQNLAKDIKEKLDQKIEQFRHNGELIACLLIGNNLFIWRFQDTLREGMEKTMQQLKKDYETLILTGDNRYNAKAVQDKLNIDQCYAELTPEEKLNYVSKISKDKGLIMVGDGVNDAPALARATAGLCMGKVGSATAIDAADSVFLHDDLHLLPWLLHKAKKTKKIVKQNLLLAIVAMFMAVIPALLGWIPLWISVIMHEGGTVLVGLNALRLLKKEKSLMKI